jgi:hypothetical protein
MNAEFTKRRQENEYSPDFYLWHENRTIRDAISILLHYSRPDEPLSAAHPGARRPLPHPDARMNGGFLNPDLPDEETARYSSKKIEPSTN